MDFIELNLNDCFSAFSAFNGYHFTPSDYSEIVCTRPGCHGRWRTKAEYVDGLPKMEGF